MSTNIPEPWLRGPLAGVHPLVMPVFFSFAQVREDLRRFTQNISDDQVWHEIAGMTLGFQLAHLAGSVDRLATYLAGQQLSEEQLQFLGNEPDKGRTLSELLRLLERSLSAAESRLRELQPGSLYDQRTVGRQQLPSTVIGLLVHLAEHTQRHLGQAITLCKLLRQTS